jgi:hypothetical protein
VQAQQLAVTAPEGLNSLAGGYGIGPDELTQEIVDAMLHVSSE